MADLNPADPHPALARVEEKVSDEVPTVLFLCVHNAGRSQMALGWFNHLAGGRAIAYSGGSEPAASVNPSAIEAMDRRRRARRRRGRHDGLRRYMPVLSWETLRGLGARGSRRERRRRSAA